MKQKNYSNKVKIIFAILVSIVSLIILYSPNYLDCKKLLDEKKLSKDVLYTREKNLNSDNSEKNYCSLINILNIGLASDEEIVHLVRIYLREGGYGKNSYVIGKIYKDNQEKFELYLDKNWFEYNKGEHVLLNNLTRETNQVLN